MPLCHYCKRMDHLSRLLNVLKETVDDVLSVVNVADTKTFSAEHY